jgi:hypothetical protein
METVRAWRQERIGYPLNTLRVPPNVRQVGEFQVRVAVLNGFTALGTPITEAARYVCPEKG